MQMLEKILEEIEEIPYPSEGIGCGIEDVGITDRYEAAAYGWNEAVERILEIIRSHMVEEPVSNTDRLDGGWIQAETPPERNMRVQALIKHHKWITDYDSAWVPEEEKTVHPERMEICEAIYKNGEFTFRRMEDDEFAETAYICPEENLAAPVCEILMWRPVECAWDNWIPAEERLPENGESVLVWYEYFRYGDYNCMFETYGIGYQYDGYWSGDVSGTNARCIAWQPLPAPYRPKEDA